MATADEIAAAIAALVASGSPKRMKEGNREAEAYSIKDLVAAYDLAKKAEASTRDPFACMRRSIVKPPGGTGV